MRKALRRLGYAALALAAVLAGAAALFLAKPEIFLTDRTVGLGLKRFGKAYAPRWSSLTFSAAAIGTRRHRYLLTAEDLCADDPKGLFAACFARLQIGVVVRWTRSGPSAEVLENFTALGGRVGVDLRKREGSSGGFSGAALLAVPVKELRLELPDLAVRTADSRFLGRLNTSLTPGARRPFSVDAVLVSRGPDGTRRLKAALAADSDLFKGAPPTYLDADGRAELRGLGRARGALRIHPAPGGFELAGSAAIDLSTGPVSRFALTGCEGALSAKPRARPTAGRLACRYEAVPARPADAGRLGPVKNLAGAARAEGELRGRRFTAKLSAEADPYASWFQMTGGGDVKLGGRLGEPLEALSYAARVTLKAKFEDLVALLRETEYAVPAPIHVLKGPVALALDSAGDPRGAKLAVKYVLTTDLEAGRQKVITRSTGTVTVLRPAEPDRSFEHDGAVVLEEVALEAPRLELGPAPKFAVDRRIVTGGEAPAAAPAADPPPPLKARVSVRTGKPALVFSNLVKEPVPAALELAATYPPGGAGGVVKIQRFGVELFRRNATVDHLNIAFSSGPEAGTLDGLVLYDAKSAAIEIRILGATDRPQIELASKPPLKREDIIGLLIFGKNPDELDPDQTASVNNTETALASQAFGLASLYLFGSTPVERVGYDPATKTTSVKLRLPGGADLTLGSDFDQTRQLTVRKPLAPHWALQSELTSQQNPATQQTRAATTFLEWFNRY